MSVKCLRYKEPVTKVNSSRISITVFICGGIPSPTEISANKQPVASPVLTTYIGCQPILFVFFCFIFELPLPHIVNMTPSLFVQPLVVQRQTRGCNLELQAMATCPQSPFTGKCEDVFSTKKVEATFRRRTRYSNSSKWRADSMVWSLGPRWTCQLGSPSTQIGRPKTSIKKDVGRAVQQPQEAQTDTERGSAKARPRRKTQEDEIPMFKVILLGDEEYVEAHVVTQLQKTVQIDKSEATRIFREAQSTGSSVVCVVCEEHAEFYAQQLRRQDIYVVVEKDE